MSTFLANTVTDAQTAITSLGGALAGVVSEEAGNYIIRKANVNAGSGIGDVGLRFIVRALVSSSSFGLATDMMPDTSGNIMFSIVFFAANPSLIRDAVTIAQILVRGVTRDLPRMIPFPGPPNPSNGPVRGDISSCRQCE